MPSSVDFNDKTLQEIKFKNYKEQRANVTITGGSCNLNLVNANVFNVSMNANITSLNISNVSTESDTIVGFTMILRADGTARSVTWPTSFRWPDATAPTLSSTNNKVDIVSFISDNNGANWYGFVNGKNF
jgi:hypothetical protein